MLHNVSFVLQVLNLILGEIQLPPFPKIFPKQLTGNFLSHVVLSQMLSCIGSSGQDCQHSIPMLIEWEETQL